MGAVYKARLEADLSLFQEFLAVDGFPGFGRRVAAHVVGDDLAFG